MHISFTTLSENQLYHKCLLRKMTENQINFLEQEQEIQLWKLGSFRNNVSYCPRQE